MVLPQHCRVRISARAARTGSHAGGTDRPTPLEGDDLIIGGIAENEDDIDSVDAALTAWDSGDLSNALLCLGSIQDDFDKDKRKGGKGDDELIGGAGDNLKQ